MTPRAVGEVMTVNERFTPQQIAEAQAWIENAAKTVHSGTLMHHNERRTIEYAVVLLSSLLSHRAALAARERERDANYEGYRLQNALREQFAQERDDMRRQIALVTDEDIAWLREQERDERAGAEKQAVAALRYGDEMDRADLAEHYRGREAMFTMRASRYARILSALTAGR